MRSCAPLALAALLALAACGGATPRSASPAPATLPSDTIRPFASEAEIRDFVAALVAEEEARIAREFPPPPREGGFRWPWQRRPLPPPPAAPPPPPAPPPAAPSAAPAAAGESVTNVQHAGVDEGGIVKVHGDHLVVLRRGRLFTVRIGDGALEPVSGVDAFGPDVDPRSAWYDEILVSGPHVVVIGYSYTRGGTELGIFHISPAGALTHRATYQLRSADYYSSRNYASRLVGDRLVLYAPIPLNRSDPAASFPALRRWEGGDTGFESTVAPTRVYRPAGELPLTGGVALHAVTSCDLADARLRCESTALFGPPGRVFYVSPGSVYVWTVPYRRGDDGPSSILYRLPLDGSAPTGVRVEGAPVDQFSFLESGDGHLNVLVRSGARGESMVGSERARGAVELLRLPLAELGTAARYAAPERYRPLPEPAGGAFQNRFVGEWLLYGTGAGWGRAGRDTAVVAYGVRWAGAEPAVPVRLPHGVDRIEAMGPGAVLIGADGRDLHFSAVRLDGGPRVMSRYTRSDASQGETRSHGFFYRPDGEDEGVLGLPVRGADRPGWEHLRYGSASIVFLRNRNFRLAELGELASAAGVPEDGCRASCVDWYGNARPLFLRGRVLALLGYELVEGREEAGRIRELRRVSFAPVPPIASLGGEWAFTESAGERGSAYVCAVRGTMGFDVAGGRLGVRFRQTGECEIDGERVDAAGAGTGEGGVGWDALRFRVDRCEYSGRMVERDRIEGELVCQFPDRAPVGGRWEAVRAR